MKKTAIALLLGMVVMMAGCTAKNEPTSSQTEETVTILVTQIDEASFIGLVTTGPASFKPYESLQVQMTDHGLIRDDIGAYVSVTYNGKVRESSPPQITGISIEKVNTGGLVDEDPGFDEF